MLKCTNSTCAVSTDHFLLVFNTCPVSIFFSSLQHVKALTGQKRTQKDGSLLKHCKMAKSDTNLMRTSERHFCGDKGRPHGDEGWLRGDERRPNGDDLGTYESKKGRDIELSPSTNPDTKVFPKVWPLLSPPSSSFHKLFSLFLVHYHTLNRSPPLWFHCLVCIWSYAASNLQKNFKIFSPNIAQLWTSITTQPTSRSEI